ncbi:hypothetical protein N658DRAFT_437319, partial [Parathielavia hyrcaniae]
MILGRPWHEDYDPDISWKGGGHLRPRDTSSHPTNSMGDSADQEPRTGGTRDDALPTGPPQEASSGWQTTTRSGRSGTRRNQKERASREIAVISIDDHGTLEFQEWVTEFEAAFITAGNDKFSYYEGAKKDDKTGQIPDEYRGHPAFEAKHMEGLPDHG